MEDTRSDALIIREAQESDLKEILSIYNDAVTNSTAVYEYEPRSLNAHLQWFQNKRKSEYPVLVAEVQAHVIEFGSYGSFRAWPAYSQTVESSVYIESRYRGKHIGRRLMVDLIERAKQQKYHTMIAGIDATNTASIKLHKNLGFIQTAYMHEVGWKFDRWLDLIFMQLIIN
jgi:L-amino acid N-acyltransferase YncA